VSLSLAEEMGVGECKFSLFISCEQCVEKFLLKKFAFLLKEDISPSFYALQIK